MKRIFTTFIFAGLLPAMCFSQQEISIKTDPSGKLKFEAKIKGVDTDVAEFKTSSEIILKSDPALTVNYKLFNQTKSQDISSAIPDSKIIQGIPSSPTLKLTVTATGKADLVIADIGKSSVKTEPPATTATDITARDYLINYFDPSKNSYHDLKSLVRSKNRYSPYKNEAYIILDEKGKLIGNIPVNIDQDDKIYIYIVIDKNDLDKYDLDIEGGEYSPSDLQIRSYEPINPISAQGKMAKDQWMVIQFERGPYTSENVTFNIKRSTGSTVESLSSYTVKVNKLYHVAVGASFISTRLEKPDFDVFPLTDTTNTINTINGGSRTMATFNVIWYWENTFKYLARGSEITRGRDILKEPGFLSRINPTFGVSLDNQFRHNLFVGGTFEFARGGSIIVGGHYGQVQQLADNNFKLGESIYSGTKDDIQLSNVMKWNLFFGITLDTRIFNKIISRN